MKKILTAATDEQLAHIKRGAAEAARRGHDVLSPSYRTPPHKSAKKAKGGGKFVPLVSEWATERDGVWRAQLALEVILPREIGGRFRGNSKDEWDYYANLRDYTMLFLRSRFSKLTFDYMTRDELTMMVVTRISPGRADHHDNLSFSMKHVVDGACTWIVYGPKNPPPDKDMKTRAMGRSDSIIVDRQTGKGRLHYYWEQMTCANNPDAYGVQLEFRSVHERRW